MPWMAKDATKYSKKATTDKLKRQWAEVANSALEQCMADDGDTDKCEASAIRQASGVIAKAALGEQEPGGPEVCACPDCDYETDKERGVPCRSIECPECGATLVAKTEEAAMEFSNSMALTIDGERVPISDLVEAYRQLAEAKMKTVAGKPRPAGDFLVVEDSDKVDSWHLPVKVNGKINRRLLGAAWAALHEGYRGNKYEGPDKAGAIRRLKALYKSEGMETPTSEAAVSEYYADEAMPVLSGWVGGATSFADAHLAHSIDRATQNIRTFTGQLQDLIYNVLREDTIEDKPPALRALLDEYMALVESELGIAVQEKVTELGEVELSESASGYVLTVSEEMADASDNRSPLRLNVALIQPGWGNTKNNHYYGADMLKRDAIVFEGAKMYATDHRQAEKSVRTEVSVVERIVGLTPEGAPIARVAIHDPDFAEATRNRARLGTLDTLECSILATGRVKPGKIEGKKGHIVEAITSAKSVDWVTQAGAGGHALNIVEDETGGGKMTEKRESAEETQVEDAAPVDEVKETELREGDTEASENATEQAPEESASEKVTLSEADVTAALAETNLPSAFVVALTAGEYADDTALAEAIEQAIAEVKKLTGSGLPFAQGASQPVEDTPLSEDERELQSLQSFNVTMREVGCDEVPIPARLQHLVKEG